MPNLFQAPPQNPLLLQQQQDPRTALALSLIRAGSQSTPVTSPWEGLGRLGSGLAGALIARNAGKEWKERGDAYNKSLAEALASSQNAVPWTNPDTGMEAAGTSGGDRLAQALLANRDTAPLALNVQAGEMERRQSSMDRRNDARFAQDLRIAGIPLEDKAKLPGAKALAEALGGVETGLQIDREKQLAPIRQTNEVNKETALGPVKATNAGLVSKAQQPYEMERIAEQGRVAAANKDRGPAGDYAGTSIEAQDSNVLLRGDPASPIYAAAYNRQAQPKVTFDPDTGKAVIIRPDMSAYRAPAFRADGGAASAPPAPGASAPPPLTGAPQPVPGPQGGAGGVTINQVAEPKVSFNENQGKAAGFADRMAKSGPIVNQNEEAGTSWFNRQANNLPGGNYLISKEYQNFEQAKQDWLIAQLRRESGAAIGDPEYLRTEKQYFPQPGDDESTIKNKRELRDVAAAAMRREAGASYKAPGAPAPQVYINPQTGEKITRGPNGDWVPVP